MNLGKNIFILSGTTEVIGTIHYTSKMAHFVPIRMFIFNNFLISSFNS